jgi:peptide/nickel transport system permease protein
MAAFILRRLLLTVPILLLVSVLVFSLIHLIPGDPAVVILGQEATPQALAALRARLGLDQPLPVQYLTWLGRVLRGDLGRSLVTNQPVLDVILTKLPATLELALGAFLISNLLAIPAGIIAATRRGTAADYSATVLAFAGLSIPHFWLGIMLLLFFAVRLQWLPASGYVPFWEDPGQNLRAMILPMIATGFRESAVVTRQLRSSLLEVLGQDYVRTARAKGLGERVVLVTHALKNALIPVVTVSGLQVAALLSGLVITEQVFSIPGFGRLIVESIFTRDFTMVQGAVLVAATMVVGVNIAVDILYAFIDPRIKLVAREAA